MQFTSALPIFAVALFLCFTLSITYKSEDRIKNSWIIPAALSFLFLLLSLQAIFAEGLFGFWTEHTGDLWGNQIWVDLLLAVGIGWFLIVPRAKAVNMHVPQWLALIICSGCVGFTAMIARIMYLEAQADQVKRVKHSALNSQQAANLV